MEALKGFSAVGCGGQPKKGFLMSRQILRILTFVFFILAGFNFHILHTYYRERISMLNYIETANYIMED